MSANEEAQDELGEQREQRMKESSIFISAASTREQMSCAENVQVQGLLERLLLPRRLPFLLQSRRRRGGVRGLCVTQPRVTSRAFHVPRRTDDDNICRKGEVCEGRAAFKCRWKRLEWIK